MKKKLLAFVLLTFGLCTGCAKNVIQAPVPGQTSTADATAFRILADAQAALHSIKIWEECSEAKNSAMVDVDGTQEPCDPTAPSFPVAAKPMLNEAIVSYNQLAVLGKAYHDGLSTDAAGLEAAENKLQADVSAVLAGVK